MDICEMFRCDKFATRGPYCSRHFQSRGKLWSNNGGYLVQNRLIDGRWVYVYQHREVMAAFLNRDLLPGETVHHINGDRSDNRIENLELWSKSQPAGQRVQDRIEWAKEFLALYGYSVTEPSTGSIAA